MVEQDEVFMNIQKWVWDVLGPFYNIWCKMEVDKDKIVKDENAPKEMSRIYML